MFTLLRAALLSLAIHTSYIKMSTEGPEATVLGSITNLLNSEECHELYLRLAIPQKSPEQPSEEDAFSPSQWKDITNMEQCQKTLNHWLEMQKDAIAWDRLARALRQIGRPDVSRELKKSLNKNRSLEPKWTIEKNQTVLGTPKSAVQTEIKAVGQQSGSRTILKKRRSHPKEESWELRSFFLKLFPLQLDNQTLQQYIDPTIQLFVACFLKGMVLWLISVCYIVCWNLCHCLFANGIHYNATPARQNMNLTVIWFHGTRRHREDEGSTSEDQGSGTEDET